MNADFEFLRIAIAFLAGFIVACLGMVYFTIKHSYKKEKQDKLVVTKADKSTAKKIIERSYSKKRAFRKLYRKTKKYSSTSRHHVAKLHEIWYY